MLRHQTVTGPLEADRLGFCQSHEHLCVEAGFHTERHPSLLIDDPEKTLTELLDYRDRGGAAVVDAQPVGCGRNASTLKWLAEQTGIHILASTGFHRLDLYPDNHWIYTLDQASLRNLFIHELLSGMYVSSTSNHLGDETDIRAGLIKTAYDKGLEEPVYRRLFAAAAEAAIETGAPVMAHIEKGQDPRTLAQYLLDLGMTSERLIFCHMDRMIEDIDIHIEIAEMGIFLEYDTIGRFKYHSDEFEISLIHRLINAGVAERLLLGLDLTRERLLSYGGFPGLTHMLNSFIPLMLASGIDQDLIDRFFIDNPSMAFAF